MENKITHTWIVGGTRGLGRAISHSFAEKGHHVLVIGKRPVEKAPKNVDSVVLDLKDTASIASSLAAWLQKTPRIDNLIFCQRYKGEGDAWADELAVSLTATHKIIELLTKEGASAPASIVVIGSVASQTVLEGQPAGYHVAKAGLDQLMRYYAVKLGPTGTRVNCVSAFTFVKEESKEFYSKNKPLHELYSKIVPLRRMASTDDIVPVVDFLCSSSAAYITGQTIAVDGGLSLPWQESIARKLTGL